MKSHKIGLFIVVVRAFLTVGYRIVFAFTTVMHRLFVLVIMVKKCGMFFVVLLPIFYPKVGVYLGYQVGGGRRLLLELTHVSCRGEPGRLERG